MSVLLGAVELFPEWVEVLWKTGELLRLDLLAQLVLAGFLGGAIGLERELSGKAAGLRTNLLICVGSTILTVLSLNLSAHFVANEYIRADPARLAAQIVSGIGFLGAGTIIQARGSVTGLTTAATLWVVAAIGIAVGVGEYVLAMGSTAFVLLALIPLGLFEKRIIQQEEQWIRVTLDGGFSAVEKLCEEISERGYRIQLTEVQRGEEENAHALTIKVVGSPEAISELSSWLTTQPNVEEFALRSPDRSVEDTFF